MTAQSSRFEFKEFREEAVDRLERIGRSRTIDLGTLDAIKSAGSPKDLIAAINDAIMKNGISGSERIDFNHIKDFLKALHW